MQITHQEAHKLIQYHADEALNPDKRGILVTHLNDCPDCRAYADKIKETEQHLRQIMHRQWNRYPLPHPSDYSNIKNIIKMNTNRILATRVAMISLAFMVFVISTWQISIPNKTNRQSLLNIYPVPTPLDQLTSTKMKFQKCEEIIYKVQENDTLDDIADKFSTPKEKIVSLNHLKTDMLNSSMELTIQICDSTPTGTVNPPSSMTPHTPGVELATYTPG